MNIFEYVINFVLLLVALAITLMLGDLVRAFRERQLIPLYWMAPVWVLLIIAWQFQLLWGAFELHKLQKDWTALEFGLLIGLTLILCFASRLIVPGRTAWGGVTAQQEEPGGGAFERFRFNGKWAIACLALYFFCAYLINIFLFDLGIYNPNNVEDLALAALLMLLICSKKPSYWVLGTVLFTLASMVGIVVLSPAHYAN